MRTLYLVIIFCLTGSFSGFAQSNKLDINNASDVLNTASAKDKSNKKPKKSYKSNKHHHSNKHFEKVADIIIDKSLKNAAEVKKANAANTRKFKKSQSEYLNKLNSNTYKNKDKNTGFFYLY
jgi:hypothetical protein